MTNGLMCYLDMDGVLADFMTSALKIHNRPELYTLPESQGNWETPDLLGITYPQFWRPIDAYEDFWASIQKTPEADEIVRIAESVFGQDNVAILTAPSLDAKCFTGKAKWIQKYYPQFRDRVIYAKSKGFLASPQRVLIDDRDKNIEEFEAAGGAGIQVPRAWNAQYELKDRVIESIMSQFAMRGY